MTETKPTTPFRHEHQVFTWLSNKWDIAQLILDLDAKSLRAKKDTLDREFIEAYSKAVLGLDRIRPPETQGHSLLMHVNVTAALALPAEALTEPVILLGTTKNRGTLQLGSDGINHLLADGNHRIAKAFFEDVQSLGVYILSAGQARKYVIR
jgi:hypothetical protein